MYELFAEAPYQIAASFDPKPFHLIAKVRPKKKQLIKRLDRFFATFKNLIRKSADKRPNKDK